MSDVWGSFWQGAEIGEHYGETARNRRGFRDNGLEGVEQEAGRAGDLAGMERARTMQRTQRRFETDEQQQAFEWFEQNAPYARNVLRRARAIQDPQQRGAFLTGQRQRFQSLGFQPEQIDEAIAALTNPETAEEAFASYDAAFTQHENPDWQLVGNQAAAIDPASGEIQLGGRIPEELGAGGRYATPDEVARAGYRPGSVVWIAPGEPPRVIQAPSAARGGAGAGGYADDGYDYEGG